MRAVRGAITVQTDSRTEILNATEKMLTELMKKNDLTKEQVVSAVFTATPDLQSCYPAEAARKMGWVDTPLMCAAEIAVRGGLSRCIRVLLHLKVESDGKTIHPVYLRDAKKLRPDLLKEENK